MDESHVTVVPGFVRELLRGDRLEQAEADVRLLMGRRVEHDLELPPVLEAGVESVESLKSATVIRGSNEPTKKGSETAWLSVMSSLLRHDPKSASRAARAWSGCLVRANMESDDPIPNRAVAGYLAGVIEAAVENDGLAEYWLDVGMVEAEADEDVWSPLFAAVRFVRAAMSEPGRPASR